MYVIVQKNANGGATTMRPLKIGDKVRHKETNAEGVVAWSNFGLSVNGFCYDAEQRLTHFKTLGEPREEVEKHWKRVYKWKFDMLRYENEQKGIKG